MMSSTMLARRRLLLAGALFSLPFGAAHADDDFPRAVWSDLLGFATSMSLQIKSRADQIGSGLANAPADVVFTSVFGDGVASPAERKRRTAAAARELALIAFRERTQLLPLIDAYIAAPSDETWAPVKSAMREVVVDLYVVDQRFARLSHDGAVAAAESLVEGKVQIILQQMQAGRPVSPQSLSAFRDFRFVFASLVTQKGRLAEQLALLANAM